MKKILSTLLVASMLLSMIPAFAVSADPTEEDILPDPDVTVGYVEDEDGFDTIDDPAEFVELARLINAGTYTNEGSIKVTADLDMNGYTYTPINYQKFSFDFDNHTVKNLHVTVDASAMTDAQLTEADNSIGMISNHLFNARAITNLKLVDSSLTVIGKDGTNLKVGGVTGYANRANVDKVELTNVAINYDGAGYVGGVIGNKSWAVNTNFLSTDMTAKLDSVVIDAPKAAVGTLFGQTGDVDINLTDDTSIDVTVKNSTNPVWDDTYAGNNGTGDRLVVADGVESTVVCQSAIMATVKIQTPEDLKKLADAANADTSGNYLAGMVVRVVNDLDMTGVNYAPIKSMKFTLDFGGHTVSNLHLTYNDADAGNYGLIANELTNDPKGAIINLVLKDSSLTVNGANDYNVGAVAGKLNRGHVSNITVENVKITSGGTGLVGGIVGNKDWGWSAGTNETMDTLVLKDVTITAPNATVGAMFGKIYVDGGKTVTIASDSSVDVTVEASKNPVWDDTLVAKNEIGTNLIIEDGIESTVVCNSEIMDSVLIMDADDLINLAEKATANSGNYLNGMVVKLGADIDMTGKTYVPFQGGKFILDFNGHKITNLNVTVTPENMDKFTARDRVEVGLIAGSMGNPGTMLNVVIEDSTLDITVPDGTLVYAGGVLGLTNDRMAIQNVTLKNVTLKMAGAVSDRSVMGGIYGEISNAATATDHYLTMENVVIDAPGALVGIVGGRSWGKWGDNDNVKIHLNDSNVDLTVKSSQNVVTAETIVASPQDEGEAKIDDNYKAKVSTTETTDAGTVITLVVIPDCAKVGHVEATPATCTTKAVCAVCGEEYGEPKGHGEGEADDTTAKAPTCTEKGKEADTICSVCGDTIATGAEIAANGHGTAVEKADTAKAPTCIDPGKYADKVCPDCGEVLEPGATIDATGHSGGTATCVAQAVCDDCQTPYGDLDLDNHNEKNVDKVDATCSKTGTEAGVICEDCGKVLSGCESIDINPDNHVNIKIENKAPTEVDFGYMGRQTCTDCGKVLFKGEIVDPCTHDNMVIDAEAKAPTCTEAGNTEGWHCDDCGYVEESIVLVAMGHSTVQVNVKDATCTEAGYTGDWDCQDCDHVVKGTTIPATGHTTVIENYKDATCTEAGYSGDEICETCGETITNGTETDMIAHTGGDATCTEKAECDVCGEEYGEAKGHGTAVEKADTAKAPTCTEKGKAADKVCPDCGVVLEAGAEIAAKGHGETEVKDAKAATETDDGYTGDTYCKDCGEKVATGEVIPATGVETPADPNKLEAEDAELASDPDREAAGEHIRVNGNGTVGWVGNGNTITYTVNVETAGKKTLTIVHTGPNDRSIEITVNGNDPITVAGTDSVAVVELVAGENTIVLGNSTAWAPDIDYIEFSAVVETPDEPVETPDAPVETPDAPVETPDVPQTGDAIIVAVAIAAIALIGMAVVSKKRHTAE